MPMFNVVTDASDVLKQVEAFEKRGGDLAPTMAIVAEMLVEAVNDEFETEGQGGWDPFAPSTVAGNSRRKGGKLLQDFGVLAGSIEPSSGPRFAEASTGVEYAVHHLFGAPKGNLPRRDFFDVPDAVFDEAIELILDVITSG